MKPYPCNEIQIVTGAPGDGGYTTPVIRPTNEAIQNFESYLNELEYVFYWQLSEAARLSIALSVNPFDAFQDVFVSN